jgi:predicted regulator of Ras-like GTPase activity (Roadblock/LC7/MglB family)
MTPHYVNQGAELNWLLDDLVDRVPQVSNAVMLTQDGLAIGASAGLNREDAEHLAALASGFQSMARGAGQHFGGGRVRQTIIEMEAAFLFVSAAGQGTCLAVLTTGDADVGLVAYEMAVLVRRSSEHLVVAPRPASYGPDHSAQRPPTMTGSNGRRGVPYPARPAPPGPGAAPPYLPGGRMTPPSMAGPPAGQLAGQAALAGSHPSRPLPKLMPQRRDAPAWDSVYSPYPIPAGRPESAPYTE